MQVDGSNQQSTTRLLGLDVCRAVAVFGMVLVNFKVAMGTENNGPPWLQMLAASVDGRAAATFVVLAGIGVSLSTRGVGHGENRTRPLKARRSLIKRAMFLTIIGWASYPLWPADILHYYGVYLLAAAALLFVSNRTLLLATGGVTIAGTIAMMLWDVTKNWDYTTLTYSGITTPTGFFRNLFIDGLHPVLPWLAFVLFGMWLGRTDLRNPQWRTTLLCWAIPIVVFSEVLAWCVVGPKGADLSHIPADSWRWLVNVAPIPPTFLFVIVGGATAVIGICGCIWLSDALPQQFIQPLVATGQLALTLYLAHWILGLGTLEEIGALTGQTLLVTVGAAIVFCVLSVVFATLWRRRFQRGPVEWVMRRLTH